MSVLLKTANENQATVFGSTPALADGHDLDILTTTGIFSVVTPANAPASSNYFVTVFSGNVGGRSRHVQVVYDVVTGAAHSRARANTGWTSWAAVGQPEPLLVAGLPDASVAGVGARYVVTDALTPVSLDVVTGGGAVTVPVFSNGTDWIVV